MGGVWEEKGEEGGGEGCWGEIVHLVGGEGIVGIRLLVRGYDGCKKYSLAMPIDGWNRMNERGTRITRS